MINRYRYQQFKERLKKETNKDILKEQLKLLSNRDKQKKYWSNLMETLK